MSKRTKRPAESSLDESSSSSISDSSVSIANPITATCFVGEQIVNNKFLILEFDVLAKGLSKN
jgi:hypothetical protein